MNSTEILEAHNAHRRGDADGVYSPTVITQAIDDCVQSAKRYELLRTLNPEQYKNLCWRNIFNGENFDAMVDKLIEGV